LTLKGREFLQRANMYR